MRLNSVVSLWPPYEEGILSIELPPTSEGLEFTLLENRMHYKLLDGRTHFTLPENRMHYEIVKER